MHPNPSLTQQAHQALAAYLKPGDIAVDATAGNGYDTLFLANAVGSGGHVYAFDIQPQAIQQTAARLGQSLASRVTLIQADHAHMKQRIPALHHGRIQAVVFNLGYLPGGEKTVITQTRTTCLACREALAMLAPGGCMSIIAYPGHQGGDEECQAVEAWLDNIASNNIALDEMERQNESIEVKKTPGLGHTSPKWFFIEKKQRHDKDRADDQQ